MKKITVKYDRKDFFGSSLYTEDSKENPGLEDVKKAFLFLGKNHDAAVQFEDSIIYYWDSVKEFENKVITVKKYEAWNSSNDEKISFQKAKNEAYNSFRE